MAVGPKLYAIAAHRGFADALVAGLIPRYSEQGYGLARLTLLLPSTRAIRTLTEAFVRQASGGLLLPRMVAVGDLDLDETLGPLLDNMVAGSAVPPAVNPTYRWLRLAAILEQVADETGPRSMASHLRRAAELARTMDRLLAEEIGPEELLQDRVIGIVGEMSAHWKVATREFALVQAHWQSELARRGEVDSATRRNLLFDHAAKVWRENPPASPIVAAGVTSAAPALARLLRVVADLPNGAVILPDLDLSLDEAVWNTLGTAGKAANVDDPPISANDKSTHPQYHLKLLLNRMGVNRDEVQPWHRAGIAAAPPERSRAISNLFLPPEASARWVDLPASERRLNGVRLMRCSHPEEEATALAVLIRQALEVPERRVALVTPDRALAARVVAQLQRWGIAADDTAGQPLSQSAAGRVLLLLAEVWAESAAPVPLIALLTHPLVARGEGRAEWLEAARQLDLGLRGPRSAVGLEPLAAIAEKRGIAEWWHGAEAQLSPLPDPGMAAPLSGLMESLTQTIQGLCGEALWSGPDGRALSMFLSDLGESAALAETRLEPRELPAVLRDAMDKVAVRPAWGGHPRVAIYGLLEARMARADLILCGGIAEGVWPAGPNADVLLPPAVLRALGVPGGDFRIGLSAHDLAGALGAPEVVLSWPERREGSPVIASRFVLRIKALLGEMAAEHEVQEAVSLAQMLDRAEPGPSYPRPQPMPSVEQRRVDISVTGLDRLRSDPYQFYASSILRLKKLELLDAEPSAAWKGEAVHAILEEWHNAGSKQGKLVPTAIAVLDSMSAHPLMRSLWRPRLLEALQWVDDKIVRARQDDGRTVLESEIWGEIRFQGIRVFGKVDRIDSLPDGKLAVVDYKSGQPPSGKMVEEGFSLQLGVLGLIADQDGFPKVKGEPERFEYWSLSKRSKDDFGFVKEPVKEGRKPTGILREEFLTKTEHYLADAIDRWILGDEAFTARLNPDLGSYNDFDQLMRLDEWLPNLRDDAGEAV